MAGEFRRKRPRAWVVDDEPDLRLLVSHNLEHDGFDVSVAERAEELLAALTVTAPAVVILDWMLPDMSGFEACRRMRALPHLADVGVMILTARDGHDERVGAVAAGVDDYMSKPFHVHEVVIRAHALARCTEERQNARYAESPPARLAFGDIELDCVQGRAFRDGVELKLRPVEFKLLSVFLGNPRNTLTREDLRNAIWDGAPVGDRSVDAQVCRLREKLGNGNALIETDYGKGYRLRTGT